jgi:hypothetical protein
MQKHKIAEIVTFDLKSAGAMFYVANKKYNLFASVTSDKNLSGIMVALLKSHAAQAGWDDVQVFPTENITTWIVVK